MKNLKYRTTIKLFLPVIILILLMSCTGKKTRQLKLIPSDASFVISANFKSLAMKSVQLKDILGFIKKDNKKNDSLINIMFNSGIDFMNIMYIWTNLDKDSDKTYSALAVPLNDEKKFEQALKENNAGIEIKKEGDIKYARYNKSAYGWKDKLALIVVTYKSDEAAKAKLIELFNENEENSLARQNTKFNEFISQTNDIAIWIKYDKLNEVSSAVNPAGALLKEKSFKDTYGGISMNFEKGKVTGNIQTIFNQETFEKYKTLNKSSLNSSVIKEHPGGDNVIAMIGLALNTQALLSLLKEMSVASTIDQNMAALLGAEYNVDYLASALSGDLVISINKLNIGDVTTYDYSTKQFVTKKGIKDTDYALSLGIKDKAMVNKLLETFVQKQIFTKEGNIYSIGGSYQLVVNDYSITIANGSKEFKENISQGRKATLSPEWSTLLASNMFIVKLDITKIPVEAKEFLQAEMKPFYSYGIDGLTINANELKNQTSNAKYEISFTNKEQNSLITLQQMVKELPLNNLPISGISELPSAENKEYLEPSVSDKEEIIKQ